MISARSRDGMVGMAIPFGHATACSLRHCAPRSTGSRTAAFARRPPRARATGYGPALSGYGPHRASRTAERIASRPIGHVASWLEKGNAVGYETSRPSDTVAMSRDTVHRSLGTSFIVVWGGRRRVSSGRRPAGEAGWR